MKLTIASVLFSTLSMSALAGSSHWEYSGHNGTQDWGELSSDFATCSNGVNQSPIDISGSLEAKLPALAIGYNKSSVEVVNNGHTIQANISGKNTFTNDDGQFELLQFHFHSPSENTINGKSFPLESHFVHTDIQGRLAVISVMFEQGTKNEVLEQVWGEMPEQVKGSNNLKKMFQSADLMPQSKDYFRFNGSLTTPPCSEGVRWFVMKQPVEASKAQIEKFRSIMGRDTNRPVQPLYARVVLK